MTDIGEVTQLKKALFLLNTQFENIGDALINRELIKLAAVASDLIVFTARAPKKFLDNMPSEELRVSYINGGMIRYILCVLKNVCNGADTTIILTPGGNVGEKSLKNYTFNFLYNIILWLFKIIGVKIVLLGTSFEDLGPRYMAIVKRRSKLLSFFAVRDLRSAELLEANGISSPHILPDLAFAIDIDETRLGCERNLNSPSFAFSFRFDLSHNNRADILSLVNCISTAYPESLLKFVVQVERDHDGMSDLANQIRRAHRGKVLVVDATSSIDVAVSAYRECEFLLANRLHALLLALSAGCVPIAALAERGDGKIKGVWQQAKLANLVIDLSDPKPVCERLSSFKVSQEARNALATNRRALQDGVKAVFSDKGVKSRTHICMIGPRPLSAVAGGMTRYIGYFITGMGDARDAWTLSFWPTRLSESGLGSYMTMVSQYVRFIFKLWRSEADVYHIHVATGNSTWRKLAYSSVLKKLGKVLVLHLHGSGYDEFYARQKPRVQSKIRAFFASADAVIVLGDGWRNWAISQHGLRLDPARVHIIDNGVPDPGLIALGEGIVPRIVFVGAVGHRKGVDVLLDALASIDRDIPWSCTICGNGDINHYNAVGMAKGIEPGRLSFTGWQNASQVRTHLKNSDIYVLPSRAENQPIAILEAMAMGLPVVATSVGDIPNQVVHSVTGFVIPSGDSESLKEVLEILLKDRELRISMGAAGRSRFQSRYDISSNVARTISLYEGILKQRQL